MKDPEPPRSADSSIALPGAASPPSPPSRVRASPAAPPSIDDLDRQICALARQMNAETHRLLVLVREFDERVGWAKWGLSSCAEWLAWRCGMSLSAAREKVRTAQALRRMPATAAAFADGLLSYSKVRALTRVVDLHDEEPLLAYALRATSPQVEERCRQIRNVAPESTATAWRAWERRSCTLFRDAARGVVRISVELPLEQGEVVAKALERAAESGDSIAGLELTTPKAPDRVHDSTQAAAANGWRAQQADALVAMAMAYLAGGNGERPRSAADHYQVVIHSDASALHGGAGRSDLPVETVRRLTCDGSLITIVEDESGTPLDVGRKRRTVTTALRRAVWARDRHCTFPGCHNRCYVDAHHIEHWTNGGETRLENLTLLCSHHHTLLHEGGFKIRRMADDSLYFERPDGRVIPRCGYRLDDICDDYSANEPSMEGWDIEEGLEPRVLNGSSAAGPGRSPARSPGCQPPECERPLERPSLEVREPQAVYRVRPVPALQQRSPSCYG